MIEELTFASSIEQAAISIHTAKVHLYNNQNFAAVAFSLEELLFYRFQKEWNKRQTLSLLLEQVQLAQFLGANPQFLLLGVILVLTYYTGFQVNRRFLRAVTRRVHYHSQSFRRPGGSSLGTAFQAVRAADAVQFFDTRRMRSDFVRALL